MDIIRNAQDFVMLAIGFVCLCVSLFAFIDCVKSAPAAFQSTGNQTKVIWLVVTGVAAGICFVSVSNPLHMFTLLAMVAAGYYLVKIRPMVRPLSNRKRPPSTGGW